MNTDGMVVLVIDDDRGNSGGRFWCDRIERAGGIAVQLEGSNSSEFLVSLENVLKDGDRVFNGTILDIIFKKEREGGILLWKSITPEMRRRLGLLMVHTKGDSLRIHPFAEEHAHGGLSTSPNPEDKEAKLQQFIRKIRESLGWPDLEQGGGTIEQRLSRLEGELAELTKQVARLSTDPLK